MGADRGRFGIRLQHAIPDLDWQLFLVPIAWTDNLSKHAPFCGRATGNAEPIRRTSRRVWQKCAPGGGHPWTHNELHRLSHNEGRSDVDSHPQRNCGVIHMPRTVWRGGTIQETAQALELPAGDCRALLSDHTFGFRDHPDDCRALVAGWRR